MPHEHCESVCVEFSPLQLLSFCFLYPWVLFELPLFPPMMKCPSCSSVLVWKKMCHWLLKINKRINKQFTSTLTLRLGSPHSYSHSLLISIRISWYLLIFPRLCSRHCYIVVPGTHLVPGAELKMWGCVSGWIRLLLGCSARVWKNTMHLFTLRPEAPGHDRRI